MLRIHKASAGSGKTYALTKEYLKLLLGRKTGEEDSAGYRLRPLSSYGRTGNKAHGEILAVTFTNKATEEMTSRIINELSVLADPQGASPYAKEFLEVFATDLPTLREHARRALADVLYNFSWFNVSTIDSFFQRVLNTFTRELDLSPNRKVELDDRYALAIAVEKMLGSINAPAGEAAEARRRRLYLENWLHQYMKAMVMEGGSFNLLSRTSSVNADLIADLGTFFNEQYKLNREAIDGYLADPSRIERFVAAISSEGVIKPLRAETEALCAAASRLCMQSPGMVNKNIADRLAAYGAGDFKTEPSATFRGCADDVDRCFNKKAEPDAAMRQVLAAAFLAAVDYFDRWKLYRKLGGQIYQLGLFGRVHEYLEEFRRDTDSLLLSDTGDLLRRIINEDETPFIYERMGTAIRHYLIDEFQDTSQMQWENLRPLVLESLSRGNDNLIIGDEKQCIYRFRNSDPGLLGSRVEQLVRSRFPDSLRLHGTDISENCNWRSSADVVRFNNTLFLSLAGQLDRLSGNSNAISATYGGLIQQIPEKHASFRGYVTVEFLPKADDDRREDAPDYEEMQLQRLVAEINRQLSAGYRPRDIAVLVRTRREGSAVIRRLMHVMENDPEWKHGVIPVMSADSMEINLSPAVRMIVNVLRLVAQPVMVTRPDGEVDAEGKPLMEVNPAYRRYRLLHRFELCRFDTVQDCDADGNPLFDSDGNPVMRRLTDSEALAKAVAATSVPIGEAPEETQRQIDAELVRLSEMDSPTLMAMTERIVGKFLTPDARSTENVFITAFQDLVMDYSDNGENNLNSFLEWWDRTGMNTNVAPPEGMDAINVLTIHKSKGLEYECVHIPYFSHPQVSYSSQYKKSVSWYRIDPRFLPGIDPDCVPPFMPMDNQKENTTIPALSADAVRWETEQRTDALNVAYVAFTRAVSELCVYVDGMATVPPPRTRSADGPRPLLSDLLLSAFREMTPEHVGQCPVPEQARPYLTPLSPFLTVTDDGFTRFEMGSPTSPRTGSGGKEAAAAAVDNGEDGGVDYGSLLDEYVVNENSDLKAAMDFEDLVDFDLSNDRHRGTFLHSVLSRVRHLSDLPRALHRQAYRYRLTPDETAMCGQQLEEALQDERARRWFEGFRRVIMERPLTAPNSVRRPDRVVWLADGTVAVVDYKFGAHNRSAYRDQVRDYVNLLEAAGHTNVKGYLWFPMKKEIIEVV